VAKTVRELDALLAEVVREIESREEQRKRGRPLIPYPALYENKKRLGARLREHLESIECPDGYGWLDLEKDEERLRELVEQSRNEGKLTPDDDAEEAYRIARTEVYRRTPKHEAWCRLTKLEQARWEGGELIAYFSGVVPAAATPGPPFSASMNSTPACSSPRRIARSLARVSALVLGIGSAR